MGNAPKHSILKSRRARRGSVCANSFSIFRVSSVSVVSGFQTQLLDLSVYPPSFREQFAYLYPTCSHPSNPFVP